MNIKHLIPITIRRLVATYIVEADHFDYRGVCGRCKGRRLLHTESRLCVVCLAEMRAGARWDFL